MSKTITIHHQEGKARPKARQECNVPILERKRVAAYCRVSTLQCEQELSYEAQQKYYISMFDNNPAYILIKVYGDDGITGTSATKRPGFMDMIRDCKCGRIDEIYTKSVSRFARNFSECVEYVRKLRDMGIVIHFEKENFSSNDENIEMLLSIMAIIAQEEVNSISQNITLAQHHRNQKGDPILPAPYGYNRDRKATNGIHLWHICDKEADRVRKAFDWYLAGYSKKAIAEMLNAYEKEQGSEKKWSNVAILNMLRREAYVGDIITNKTYTVDYLTKESRVNNGEREQFYLRNHHPAIVSREDFAKVQQMLGKELPECMRKADEAEGIRNA